MKSGSSDVKLCQQSLNSIVVYMMSTSGLGNQLVIAIYWY